MLLRLNQGFGREEFQICRDRIAGFFHQRAYEIPEREISPGVYFLTLKGSIVYVGSSVAPLTRIGHHRVAGKTFRTRDEAHRAKQFDGAFVYTCSSHDDALELEGALIRQLEPRFNGGYVHSKYALKAPGGNCAVNDQRILEKHGFL